MKNTSNIVMYADESTNTSCKEMLEILTECFDEALNDFKMDYIVLTKVSSTKKLNWK